MNEEIIKTQICDWTKKYYGKSIDQLVTALLFCHHNNLFGKSMDGRSYTLDMVIRALNHKQTVDMDSYFDDQVMRCYKQYQDMDTRESAVMTLEMTFRTLFGYYERFEKL